MEIIMQIFTITETQRLLIMPILICSGIMAVQLKLFGHETMEDLKEQGIDAVGEYVKRG